MATPRISEWRKLPLSLAELCIDTTLRCGQSFRWRKVDDEWHCTLHGRIVSLKQDPTHLHYRATWPKATTARPAAAPLSPPASVKGVSPSPAKDASARENPAVDDTGDLVSSYFNLSLSLAELYKTWSASDANFARRAPQFTGIRILNQDAWEALVAFICSSNNNISRISQMVHKLCLHYGPYIGTIGDEQYFDFPAPEALAGPKVESHLRELGFGYRAKYIAETARLVSKDRPKGWLLGLRNPKNPALGLKPSAESTAAAVTEEATYKSAQEALLGLTGVGPKVADCVCLMGLGWGEAVPVDTHVWQIAQRDYKLGKGIKSKSFTKTMYDTVGDHFRDIWGSHAGWAQSVLFTANLRSFAEQAAATPPPKVRAVKEEVQILETAETDEIATSPSTIRTRKRKTVVAEVPLETEEGKRKIAEVEVTQTRTSKRRRRSGA